MKIPIKIKYTEEYVPPRCRNPRYEEKQEEINLNIREVNGEDAPIAFIVSEFERERREVRCHKGQLYRQVQDRQKLNRETGFRERDETKPLWENQTADECEWRWILTYSQKVNESRAYNVLAAKVRAKDFIIINGWAYEKCHEPYYHVTCFGLGRNHGGTGFFVGWSTKSRQTIHGWNALDYNAAVEGAVKVALGRGDTDSEAYIRKGGNANEIEVLMPQCVKKKYKSQAD